VPEMTDNRGRPIWVKHNVGVGLKGVGTHKPGLTVWPMPLSLAEERVSVGDNAS
jgi:hypothetical protein